MPWPRSVGDAPWVLSYGSLYDVGPAYDRLASDFAGTRSIAGESVEGRQILRYDFGPEEGPAVMFTAMIHGLELIGGVALHAAIAALLEKGDPPRLVVLPSVNPDGVARNLDRHRAGKNAARRSNANGVDLNRNFEQVITGRLFHPFSGSSLRWSPHYRGTEPFSEPESRAIRDVALAVRPYLSFAFHSFGNLLLHPWSHTKAPHPRTPEYETIGDAFRAAQARPYRRLQGYGFYPIAGDLDDWLDATLGALALTIEVGRPDRRILRPERLFDPFHWMNALAPEEWVPDAVAGVLAAIEAAPRPGVAARFDAAR